MNKVIIILLVLTSVACSSGKNNSNPIKDTPKELTHKYGTDLVPSKNVASEIASIIWKERYLNDDIDAYKPFNVSSIEDDKVWEVIAKSPNKNTVLKRVYHMKINKNTGEILNNWVEK